MAATVAAIRGSLGEPTPQIFAQLTLANAVTRNVVFSHVTQVRSALPLPAPLPAAPTAAAAAAAAGAAEAPAPARAAPPPHADR